MFNTNINFIAAPVEATPFNQFEIGSILPSSGIINIFSNNYFILIFVVFSFLYFQYESNATNMTVIPNKYHDTLEGLYGFLYTMSVDNVVKKGNDFFPLLFTLFTFILTCNMIGMVPLSLTITSQLQFVLSLALGLFIGINIIGFLRHGLHFFSF
jgi:F0F1-type ATP synthase membrane subunit a